MASPEPRPRNPSWLAFAHAPSVVQSEFEERTAPIRLPAGKLLLTPGKPCSGMAFLDTGCLRVYLIGSEGREITLYRVYPGETCLLSAACILGGSCFPASAVVETPTTGRLVASATFQDWVNRHAYWREHVFRMLGERMACVLARLEESAFVRMDARLARFLLQHPGAPAKRILTTHQQIANDLGSAREVVTRALKRWQESGIVKLRRGSLEILEPQQIERLARETERL